MQQGNKLMILSVSSDYQTLYVGALSKNSDKGKKDDTSLELQQIDISDPLLSNYLRESSSKLDEPNKEMEAKFVSKVFQSFSMEGKLTFHF